MGQEDFIERLKQDEGFRSETYEDSVGVLTIGYGTNLEQGITKEQAECLLRTEVEKKSRRVKDALPELWETLSETRKAVLVNMAFNLGTEGMLSFKAMLKAVRAGNFDTAADEMLDSKWHEQVGRRAERLAKQMRTNEPQGYN